MNKNNVNKNERKGTARLMGVSLVSLVVVAAGVPSYFALDFKSGLEESKDLVETLENAAESHDDELAAAREETKRAQEAKAAAVSLNDDLQVDVKKGDEELAALRVKLEFEERRASPGESCADACVDAWDELFACNELRIGWARRFRGWDPTERPWVGLAKDGDK